MNEPSAHVKSKQWPQYLATCTATLLSLSAGLHFGWPAPAIPKLTNNELQFPVSKEQAAYLAMMNPAGYIIGCPVTSILLDRLGRKFTMLIWAGPQILAWLLIAQSTRIETLYIARLIAAISEGGAYSSVPVYICEISEPHIRGILGTIFSVASIMGVLIINCLASYLSLRTSAYIASLVSLFFVVTFVWMPRSPYCCIMKDDIEAARRNLRKLRKIQNVEEELTELISDVHRQTSEPSRLRDLFVIRSNLKALLILIGLRTVQQFSGGASLQFYAQVIFQEAAGRVDYITSSVVFNVAFVTVTAGGSLLIDRAGRKPLLIMSLVGSAICLFAEGVYFALQHYQHDVSSLKWLPLTGMVLYTLSRGFGILAIPSLMTGELFSASVKANAVGIVNFHFALCVSVSTKMFQWLSDEIAMYVPFFFYFCCAIVGIIFVHFCIPETKGKTLEEIQQYLKGTTPNS